MIYTKGVSSRDLLQFHRIQYILKESFEKKKQSTIPNKLDLYWKCPFHNFTNFNLYYYVSLKFDFILKMSLQKTHSTIPTKLDLYWRCFFKRHFSQFYKIQYVLKFWFHNFTNFNLYWFYIEGVSWKTPAIPKKLDLY